MERIGMMMAAGLSASACLGAEPVSPVLAPRGTMPERHVAHIYFNLATGERVATLIDDAARPADNGVSLTLWVSDNTTPCAAFGQSYGNSGVMDVPGCTAPYATMCFGEIYMDWGDVAFDQVVDCVGISWSTVAPDSDTDGDGLGDGVEGFGATWAWFDADDGFDSSATRLPLVGFTLQNLPGYVGTFEPELLIMYTATIDLVGSASASGMVFEIGDTDSDSVADVFNPGVGSTSDLDSDSKADFSYTLQYIQPGTFDFDGDGVLDGDTADMAMNGWSLAAGNGDVSTDGSVYTPEVSAPGDVGAEDAFDVFFDFEPGGEQYYLGTFWYGGFHCDMDGDGVWVPGSDENPWAQFYVVLYGPEDDSECVADIAPPFGLLNFFDLNLFLQWFFAQNPVADIAPPFGSWDFFDLVEFVRAFNEGCP